jgi:hypothetical protein
MSGECKPVKCESFLLALADKNRHIRDREMIECNVRGKVEETSPAWRGKVFVYDLPSAVWTMLHVWGVTPKTVFPNVRLSGPNVRNSETGVVGGMISTNQMTAFFRVNPSPTGALDDISIDAVTSETVPVLRTQGLTG